MVAQKVTGPMHKIIHGTKHGPRNRTKYETKHGRANNYSNSSYTMKVIMNIYISNICLNMQM